MHKPPLFAGLVLFLILGVSPAGAASVSFLVMETGLPEEGPANQYSILWENSLLEVFFDSGHIVSNAPLLRIAEKPAESFPDEAEKDIDNAQEGGMDFFLIAIVDFQGRQRNADVVLRLFNIKTRKLIQEQKHSYKTFKTAKEQQDDIKKTIRVMSARLN